MAGRPPKKYNPEIGEKVQAMAQYGVPLEGIAHICEMDIKTLKKYYNSELLKGVTLANMAVGKKLFERCMQGDVTSLIFWAKTRMQWREIDKKDIDKKAAENAETLKQLTQAISDAFKSVGN